MYQIKCFNGATEFYIYDPRVKAYSVTVPKLALKLNTSGMLTFGIPDNHPNKDQILPLTSDIVVYEDGEAIWYGRRITSEKDFYKTGQITCEGELAFLFDSIYRPFAYTGTITDFLTNLITNHNSQVEARKRFTLGTVSVVDTNGNVARSSEDAMKTLDVISTRLIATNGGYLRVRHVGAVKYLDYLADYGNTATQTIEFGKNLIDLTQFFDATKVRTCLIPYGAEIEGSGTGERLTIESVNGGLDYISNSGAIASFGQIWETVVFKDVTDASNLKVKAIAYLGELIAQSLTLKLSAVDMAVLGIEESIKLGDWVRVKSIPHGLDTLFLETARDIPLANPENTKMAFGSVKQSFTTQNNQAQLSISKAVDQMTARILLATQLITGAVGGHVVLDPPERPSRILIMDTPDKETAQNVWQWNINGLGFSSTGINGTYGSIALTMDGKINGDMVLVGKVLAKYLQIDGEATFGTGYDPSTKETPTGAQAKADAAYAAAQSFVNGVASGLQSQIDGSITTWFYAYAPTLANVPASGWTTTALKNQHLGDLFYDTATGYSYRYQLVSTTYSWQRITDTDVTKALADAAAAKDVADGKRRVFVATPTTPYDVGDLWAGGSAGDLKKCSTARVSGAYVAGDWTLASKYTDDTAAIAAAGLAQDAQDAADLADGKAVTANNLLADLASDSKLTGVEKQAVQKEWNSIVSEVALNDAQADAFGVSRAVYDPAYTALSTYITPLLASLTATSDIVGATFRTNFKNYYDARTNLLNAFATAAKAKADRQRTTYMTTPTTPYYVGDLWLTSTTDFLGDLKKCTTQRLTGAYTASDWVVALGPVELAKLGQTIIEGGFLKNDLIETHSLLADKFATTSPNLLYDIDSFEQSNGVEPPGSKGLLTTCAGSDEEAYHGRVSLKTVNSAANSYKYLNPKAGNNIGWIKLGIGRYLLSAYVKTTSATDVSVTIDPVCRQGETSTAVTSGATDTPGTATLNSEDGWVRVTAVILVTSLTQNPYLAFYVRTATAAASTVYWDAIQLEFIGTRTDAIAAPFAPGGMVNISGRSIIAGLIASLSGEVYFDLDNNVLVCNKMAGSGTNASNIEIDDVNDGTYTLKGLSMNVWNGVSAYLQALGISYSTSNGITHFQGSNSKYSLDFINGGAWYQGIRLRAASSSLQYNSLWVDENSIYIEGYMTGYDSVNLLSPGPVIPPTLLNGWVNYGGGSDPDAGYYKRDGRVYLSGVIKSGSLGYAAFTLPAGYRPALRQNIVCVSNELYGKIQVRPTGDVVPAVGSNAWFSLEGISFRV